MSDLTVVDVINTIRHVYPADTLLRLADLVLPEIERTDENDLTEKQLEKADIVKISVEGSQIRYCYRKDATAEFGHIIPVNVETNLEFKRNLNLLSFYSLDDAVLMITFARINELAA